MRRLAVAAAIANGIMTNHVHGNITPIATALMIMMIPAISTQYTE
jgi:hypothetical protein